MKILRSVRALLVLAWGQNRALFVRATVLLAASYLAAPLIAVGLAHFVNAALAGDTGKAVGLGVGLAALVVVDLTFGHFAHVYCCELGEMVQVSLNGELFTLANEDTSLERREQPLYEDKLQLAREGLEQTLFAVKTAMMFSCLVIQLLITVGLLASQGLLLTLLPALALGLIAASRVAHRVRQRAEERGTQHTRQSNHLLELATFSSSTLLELQTLGLEEAIIARQKQAWDRATKAHLRGHVIATVIQCVGQLLFISGYAGAILLVFWQVASGRAAIGDLLLVLVLTVQMGGQVIAVVELLDQLERFGVTLERMTWLRGQGTSSGTGGQASAGASQAQGIRLEGVGFRYPGRDVDAVSDLTVDIPAGSVVALVGENGAGKSTLVKLLCGMYTPTTGHILHGDGTEVTPEAGAKDVRDRVSCMFQDFARIQLSVLDSVGVGDVRRLGAPAVGAALAEAGAQGLVESLPRGLETILGQRYVPGHELSGGQWQKVALARALMRSDARLIALDEPAAALDAASEHELFERFVAMSRDVADRSGITLFVSHRFSTVRMADWIIVMEDGRITQSGRHEDLMRAGGVYADLYQLQARAYTTNT
ncbi:ATP-binding cassette domain-containing protein [Streptomyces sp. BK205]|uniref:ABC transporter ATP-binding protein n=1 Tax=Streptomyces sp. BK205 TaxID=2512164 RepID=UPI001046BC7B|nr:ATP-binding cassette domain-containing protein [Streptomyces sp. BK205]TCR16028.1 ATP-binding cassette subfamily B protein [Streptomyces sp. BK205]